MKNLEKEVTVILPLGSMVSDKAKENEEIIHDKIVYRMFETVLKSLAESEIEECRQKIGIENLEHFNMKYAAIISYLLKSLVILENVDRVAFIVPPIVTEQQLQYYENYYMNTNKRVLGFVFEEQLNEYYDLTDNENSKNIVYNKIKDNMQKEPKLS